MPLPLNKVAISDNFWTERIRVAREVSIDYMWKALNDEIPGIPESGCIHNFKVAAGLEKGEFKGMVFQDSDLYKWLEAVSYSLATHPDKELEERADYAIDLIGKAQLEDGYLDTNYSLNDISKRWTDTSHNHEMYCAGHMIEAAVAYKNATGKDKFLNIARRLADHIDTVFGPEPGKKRGYPGHQEIELALYKLYQSTGDKKYVDLALFFLDQRGTSPNFFQQEMEATPDLESKQKHFFRNRYHGPREYSYQQAHVPVYEQDSAIGHAVRCLYMLAGMVDVGGSISPKMMEAAKKLYKNIAETQMYITGGVGSMADGEAFTFSYDMPNDIMYNETCASIALMMVCQRMLEFDHNADYADVMERALYNTVLAGVSLDGSKFFYVNPMEVWPERSNGRNDYRSVKVERQGWYGCACCPTNVLRTLLGLGNYIYTQDKDKLFVNLYVGSRAEFQAGGKTVTLEQDGDYPRSGALNFKISVKEPVEFSLNLRLPKYCGDPKLTVCGQSVEVKGITENGYAVIKRQFKDGDVIELDLPMNAEFIYCDDRVPYNAGKTAVQRGPLVYCAEEIDNGKQLWNLSVDAKSQIKERKDASMPGEPVVLEVNGFRLETSKTDLYSTEKPKANPAKMTLVPYYMWGNRKAGEMTVWQRTN